MCQSSSHAIHLMLIAVWSRRRRKRSRKEEEEGEGEEEEDDDDDDDDDHEEDDFNDDEDDVSWAITSPFFRPCPRAIGTVICCRARTFLDHCARRVTFIPEKQVSKFSICQQ